jgi:hypothetical protein
MGWLLSPVAGHEKKPALRAGAGWIELVGFGSVCAAALESFEHQIAHRADVGLNAFLPIGIVVAIFRPLAIGAVAFGREFAVETSQHGVVREGNARDSGEEGDCAADKCSDRGSEAMIAKSRANLLQDRCFLIHGVVLQ